MHQNILKLHSTVMIKPVIWLLSGILLFSSFSCTPSETRTPAGYVDPFIGTGGHGHTFPGATLPFGMVQLSPDTRLEGWDGCSGYHYTDSIVYGFSHTHLSGTGVSDYGDILLMPMTGPHRFENGYESSPDSGYASRFSKTNEKASPGYYATHLDDYNIDVELTATERVGFHKYTFREAGEAHIILDLEHRDKLVDFDLDVTKKNELTGFRVSDAWAREQHVYFVAQFSKDAKGNEVLGEAMPFSVRETDPGRSMKIALHFDVQKDETIFVKVGISAVSVEGARKNLEAELPGWDFEGTKNAADSIWENALRKIEVEGGTEDQKTIFYTALYHTMIAPNSFMDVDGKYRGTDLEIHAVNPDETKQYTVFSLWDTFRGTHPLYTIIEQKRTREFIETFLRQYDDGGQLPVWELAGNYTGCMIGYHSIPVIADAYVKGITGFDTEKALEAMRHSAEQNHLGLEAYRTKGFIGTEDEPESVSKALEYAYDDWCIATYAKSIGQDSVYGAYIRRAQYYKNHFDPETGFMRAKTNGGWFKPFDPAEVNFNYTEANAWQYNLFVPQDISGLMALMGGAEKLEARLDEMFSANSATTGREQADITGLIGQYAHGNEPSHHMAYLYNFVGQPGKTQALVRQIMDELYTAQPDGLSGNEDCGQMSAWYVLSAMGFYSVTPGVPEYIIGSPIFDKVTLNLENGKQFVMTAQNNAATHPYIQSMRRNGAPHNAFALSHATIMAGGNFEFEMGPAPNQSWQSAEFPATKIDDKLIIPVPYIDAESRTFADSLEIRLACPDTAAEIVYYFEGAKPAYEYAGPFKIGQSGWLGAYATKDGRFSKSIFAGFSKIKGGRSITLHSEYANQYAASGDNALIDYIRGGPEFRTGSWQGYREDLSAVVDLGVQEKVKNVSVGFLQDIKSWIWMPKQIIYSVSKDGQKWTEIANFPPGIPDDKEGAIIQEYQRALPASIGKIRYIKVEAKQYGVCPDWHLGAGGKTWIFVDEILVE